MSDKSDNKNHSRRRMVNRSVGLCPNELHKSLCVDDLTKNFDCLKVSILNKACRVSGEFGKVTLGPHADRENGHSPNTVNENESRTNKPSINRTMSPRTNITFSIKKILLENEVQRREKVKKAVEQKKQEMEKSQKEIHEELSQLLSRMAIQREKETAEKLARLEAEEEQIAQQLEIDRKNEIRKQRLKESEEISKKIVPFRESFESKWKDIANVSKACRDKNSATRLLTAHAARLKELLTQMESINEKSRSGDLTSADIKMAEIVVQCSDEVFQLFKSEIDHIDALYEEEIARREMEVKRAELQAQEEALRLKQIQDSQNEIKQQSFHAEQPEIRHEQQSVIIQNQQVSEVDSANVGSQPPQNLNIPEPAAPRSSNEVPTENPSEGTFEYPDQECLNLYIENQQFLEQYASSYQEFVTADSMKKLKSECRKTLNITVNAISHVSREQLIDKYEKLKLFLSGKGNPNISNNPQAEAFSKNLLAQKIVDQGDATISSKPELAFPFAAITVALWNDWSDFGVLFLARFRAKSPFFVPVFFVQQKDQSDQDYFKSLGGIYNADGTPEKPEQFVKRLGGLMYLYASILVTKQRQGVNKSHPHGIGNAWRWLAATLNMEPRFDIADICATLIYAILEVTGSDLWKTYPSQFPKMLLLLHNVYFEKLKSFDTDSSSAPISRLGDFLTTALQKGSIPPPKGQLPPNFW